MYRVPEEIAYVYPDPIIKYGGLDHIVVTEEHMSNIIKERKLNIFEYASKLNSRPVYVGFKKSKATSYFLYKINKYGKCIAAKNKNTESEILYKLSQEADTPDHFIILINLAKNESTPINAFRSILDKGSIYIVEIIVRNTSAPACILEDIVQRYVSASYIVSQKYLVYSLLEHQNIPEYLRRHLSQLYEKIIENEYINYKYFGEESIFRKYNV